jgi:hypothetical protein
MENVKNSSGERGSLSLEHILFIGAVVLITTGLGVFYNNINDYFRTVGFSTAPANLGASGN